MIVNKNDIYKNVLKSAIIHTSVENSMIIAEKISLAEAMNASTHGIHYYNRVIKPFLSVDKNYFKYKIVGNTIHSENKNINGIINTSKIISEVSKVAKKKGISIGYIKNPGKIGALRVYVPEILSKGQTVLIFKNTAKSMGTHLDPRPIFGTNPFCFGLANTDYVFDSSTTVCATNKLRLYSKKNSLFKFDVGINTEYQLTKNPNDILENNFSMLPFAGKHLWYKSFFIAMFIEGMAAMAGGFTSTRVGEHKGDRYYSQEGMVIIILDSNHFFEKDHYDSEIKNLFNEVEEHGYRIPGKQNELPIEVIDKDWEELMNI